MRIALALSLLLAAPAWAHEPAAIEQGRDHHQAPAAAAAVQKTADGAVYGAPIAQAAPSAIRLDEVVAKPDAAIGKSGAYSGRITQVCQKQGCWLVLSADNGDFARVFMHDHRFSVPKDARGEAIVYGTVSEKKLTAEEVAHLKKDGAAAPAARELQIDATSVVIREAG